MDQADEAAMTVPEPGRPIGHQVAEWVAKQGSQHDGIDVEVVDIKHYNLPVFDEPQAPLLRSYAPHTEVEQQDRPVRRIHLRHPGVQPIDPLGVEECHRLPLRRVEQPGGGLHLLRQQRRRCPRVEHLRLITAGLQLAGVRTQVSLSLATDFASFTTFTPGDRHNTCSASSSPR
jgi:hypothetical protein